MEEEEKLPVVSMRDVIRYPFMTPAEKAQAKKWTSIKLLIYCIKDPERGLLYIGMTKRGLVKRIEQHVREQTVIGQMIHYRPDMASTWSITLIPCETVEQAKKGERSFIAGWRPALNDQHNPDSYKRSLRRK